MSTELPVRRTRESDLEGRPAPHLFSVAMPDEAEPAGPDRLQRLADQWLGLSMLANLPAAVWLKDVEGRFLGCNEAFASYLGTTETAIVGKVDTDFVDDESAALFRKQDHLAMSSDVPVSNEEWIVSAADGARVRWETTKTLVRDEAGNPVGVLGVAFDITDRERGHRELQRRTDALAEAERLARIGSWSIESQSGETTWSNEMYRILGVDPSTFVPSPDSIRSLVHPADAEALDASVAEADEAGTAYLVQHRLVVGEEVKYVEHRGQFERDEFGVTLRTSGTVQDMTERVREAARAERMSRLVDRAADAVALIDVDTGRLIDCNQRACDEFGGTREELLELYVWDLVDEVSDWLWRPIADTVDGSELVRCKIRRLDQTLIPAEVAMERFEDEGRDLVIAGARDVSDRIERERVLRESAQQYEALVRSGRDGFVLVDADGRILDVNEHYCAQSGYARFELIGQPFLALEESTEPEVAAARRERIKTTGGEIYETVHHRSDGSTWPVEVSVRYGSQPDDCFFIVVRDLTEHHRSEQELRRSADRWSTLVDGTRDGFVRLDGSGNIVDVNQRICDFTGLGRADLLGRSIGLFDHDIDERGIEELFARARRERTVQFSSRLGPVGGPSIPVEVSLTFDPGADGQFFAFARDVSEQVRMHETAQRSATQFDAVLSTAQDGFVFVDLEGRVVDTNDRYAELSGYDRDELREMSLSQLNAVDTPDGVGERVTLAEREGSALFQTWHRRKDGTVWPVEVSVTYVDIDGGRLLGFVRDLTDRYEAERTVRVAAERYRALLAGSNDGFARTTLNGTIVEVNGRLAQILGTTEEALIGTSIGDHDADGTASGYFQDLLHGGPASRQFVAARMRRADGSVLPVEIDVGFAPSDGGQIFAFIRDVSERVEAERKIEFLAYNDALTGLPNRAGFSHLLADALERAAGDGRFVAVCYLDLDGFKPVNDRFGHEMGDAVLVRFAERLRETVRAHDTVARFGGDEFVVLVEDLASIEQVHEFAERLVAACETPLSVGDRRIHLSASIGITVSPADDGDEDVLLRHADQAMYRAKASGKNTYELFDPVVDSELARRRDEIEEFELALERNELVLHFQPRVDLSSGEPVGVEALVRWQHPTRGLLLPGEFLPLIDATPLEFALDEWVLRVALDQLAAWDEVGITLGISVNLSPRHIAKPTFPEYLAQLLGHYRAGLAERLELEIIETAAVGQIDEVARIMERCAELGVTFSLDDFGTGYSSLTHFSSLPVNVLKIDQSFVRRLLDDARNLDIVEGVIQLAKALGRPVVAEGVESVEIGLLLWSLDCQYAQGFGIAAPMEASLIPEWVRTFRASSPWNDVAPGLDTCCELRDLDVARHVHAQWVDQVLGFAREDPATERPRTTLDECPFLAWYEGAGRDRYGELEWFGQAIDLHDRMHELGAELVHGAEDGTPPTGEQLRSFAEAAGRFEIALKRLLSEVSSKVDDPAEIVCSGNSSCRWSEVGVSAASDGDSDA